MAGRPKKEQRTAGQQRQAKRTRVFATVVYPESAPSDWIERLDAHHVPAIISPLHDRDQNPDGATKKPHYHVMVLFESPKDFNDQVKPIFDNIGGVGREKISSQRGYARYLCHLDNPEKAQYSSADVRQLGGADYQTLIHLPNDDITALFAIMDYIVTKEIYSFAELLDVLRASPQPEHRDWCSLILTSKTYTVREYIKSLQWECDAEYVRVSDRAQEKRKNSCANPCKH